MEDPVFIGTMVVAGISVLCALGAGVAIIVFFLRRSRRADSLNQASQSWSSTAGTVIKSRAEVSSGEHSTVTPRVIYQYSVGGVTYEGNQIRAGDSLMPRGGTSTQAYATIDRYPEGAPVTVYYNPANPSESALER